MEKETKSSMSFKKNGKSGVTNGKGVAGTPPMWWLVGSRFSEGLCAVVNEDKMIGYVDANGELVIPFQYKKGCEFKNCVAMVSDDSGKWGAIDQENELVEPFIYSWNELYGKLYDAIIHELKILPEYYRLIEIGEKTFEVRFNDRDFTKGDILFLREHDENGYTGRAISAEVTYLLDNPRYCKKYFAIMTIRVCNILTPVEIGLANGIQQKEELPLPLRPKKGKTFYIEEEHPVLDERLLNKDSLYDLEYRLIPQYVWSVGKRNGDVTKLYDFSVWSQDLIRRMYSTKVIDWEEIVCEVMGDINNEFLVIYEFPKPFKEPLAKFGAVYISKRDEIFEYFTLEKSYGAYMFGSMKTDIHYDLCNMDDISKDEFVKKVCRYAEIDETLLEKKMVVRMEVGS